VLLTDFNQGTTSGKLSLRGFNGEGEVNAVKLLIDGIPSNSNDGNMPYLDFVFPLEIDSITTVRGTNDARFGLHNIAGNVDLATRQGGNDTDVRVGLGSFGLADVQLLKGIESGNWAQTYFIGARRSEGYREHASSRKYSLSGKWFYRADNAAWRIGLIARHHQHTADEPGYLTDAQTEATPTLSPAFAASDGDERTLDQLSLHADGQATSTLAWQAKVYVNKIDDQRWVRFSAGVSQQERDTIEDHRGARVSLSWRPQVSGLTGFALEGGVDTERQDNISQRYTTANRVRATRTRDQAWTLDVTGAFVQAVIKPVASLSIVPGLRVDRVDGELVNHLNNTTYAVNDYGSIRQPKISAVWTVAQGQSVFANVGRSFQIGIGAASFKVPPRTTDLEASVNDGWETGWKFQQGNHLTGRVAVWQQKASNEVMRRLNDPSGDSDNIGSTRRRGLDLQLRARVRADVETWASWAQQKAVIVVPDPSAPTTAGKELDHVPHRVYTLGADWQVQPNLRLSGGLRGQSDYELRRQNDQGRYGAFNVLDVGGSWKLAPAWEVGLDVRNLTDRATEYVWYDGTQRLHSPGEPRSLQLSLRARL
jgi:iron complex outermembrane receptor protein